MKTYHYSPDIQLMSRLMQLVKAFHGDVFGNILVRSPFFVTEVAAAAHEFDDDDKNIKASRRGPPPELFRCRIAPEQVMQFLSVLRIDYDLVRMDNNSAGTYMVKQKRTVDDCSILLELQITVLPRREWFLNSTDFDVDMVAMDSFRLYVRPSAQTRLNPPTDDVLGHLMQRLRDRKFCLTDGGRTIEQNQRAMRRAYNMVSFGGWSMDDRVLGRNGWVMTRWSDCERHLRASDKAGSGGGYSSSNRRRLFGGLSTESSKVMCPLCHEPFSAADVVVHLCCGHAFHFKCGSSSSTSTLMQQSASSTGNDVVVTCDDNRACGDSRGEEGGLSAWLNTAGGNTCPYCRNVI
jgi:hypothetical protein